MAGIGSYEKGKAFALKSGNKPSFKSMGSSPAKMHKPGHTGPAPKTTSRKEELLNQGFTQKDADLMIKSGAVTGEVGGKAAKPAYIKTIQNKKAKGGKLTKAEKRQLDEYRIHVTEQKSPLKLGKQFEKSQQKARDEHESYTKQTARIDEAAGRSAVAREKVYKSMYGDK